MTGSGRQLDRFRLDLGDQGLHDGVELLAKLRCVQAPAVVEPCVHVADRDLTRNDSRPGGPEHLAELLVVGRHLLEILVELELDAAALEHLTR